MKNLLLAIFLFGIFSGTAQSDLNNYKYIVVPKTLDGFKKENQYQTSTLVKHLFTEKGFKAIYEDALPDDLNSNRCLALYVGLDEKSSMFSTKTTLLLNDCSGKEVFVTKQGKSKDKDYKTGYSEALRDAFSSFDSVNYSYEPSTQQTAPITVSFKNDVKKMDEPTDDKKASKNRTEQSVVEQEATIDKQSYKDRTPVPSDIKKPELPEEKRVAVQTDRPKEGVLYAQAISSGYQLVDSTPKIKIKMFKTSQSDMYLAKSDVTDGIVYKKEGKWFFEYYSGDNLMTEELDIKF